MLHLPSRPEGTGNRSAGGHGAGTVGLRLLPRRIAASVPTLVSIAAIVPVGFYLKLYRGPGAHWVNDSFDGALYVAFWCLVVFLLRPRWRPWRIAAGALAATCFLEFLQLWHPHFLQIARSNFIGVTILGDTFQWSDFPYYFFGAGLGWMWLARLESHRRRYDRMK